MSALPVWRLCAAQFASTAFSGEGAREFGGRWSPPGLPVVYCAESRALAVLEILAQAEDRRRLAILPWVLISAEIPDALVEKPSRYPPSWRDYPHSGEIQGFGAEWAKAQRAPVLRVPSAVVPGEFNYLLNPQHPDFKKIRLGAPERFSFDGRLAR